MRHFYSIMISKNLAAIEFFTFWLSESELDQTIEGLKKLGYTEIIAVKA